MKRPRSHCHRGQTLSLAGYSRAAQGRKAQIEEAKKARQPVLFELRDDRRPVPERIAAGRYAEPSLFTVLE